MSRFFDFTLAGFEFNVMNRNTNPDLFLEMFRHNEHTSLRVPAMLSAGGWTHVAASAGNEGWKLFVNGMLVGTNATTEPWPTTGLGTNNYLGRSNYKAVYTSDADFNGQMAEVSVWRGVRTEAQVRQDMFQELTGKEPGLVGLWNFKDGTANDASGGGHHGKLMGQARVVEAQLPSASAMVPWSRLVLQVTNAAGAALPNVDIRAQVNGVEVGHTTGDSAGMAPLTVWTRAGAVDVAASGSNDLGGWRLAVPITPYAERTEPWKLGPAIHLAGRALALDAKTPHVGLVVELVRPAGEAATCTGCAHQPFALAGCPRELGLISFDSGPAIGRHELSGAAPGHLPRADECHVEAWVKWDRLGPAGDLFDFGKLGSEIWVSPGGGAGPRTPQT